MHTMNSMEQNKGGNFCMNNEKTYKLMGRVGGGTLALGIPKGDKGDNGPMPASFVVLLPKSGWNGKMQTVSNDKFLATGYVYTVRPDGSSFADSEMAGVHSDNVIEDGKMIFYCNTIPETDLTMNVLRMDVTA